MNEFELAASVLRAAIVLTILACIGAVFLPPLPL
jgi:hypothetical protein